MKPRFLLLHPPGSRRYIRDYACSKVSQARYLHPPIDLVLQSGHLDREHELVLVDGIAEGLDPAAAARRVRAMRPAAALALVGAVSWPEDVAFLRGIRGAIRGPRFVTGDAVLEDTAARLADLGCADGALLDFSSSALARHLRGETGISPGALMPAGAGEGALRPGMDPVGAGSAPPRSGRGAGTLSIPLPRHDLFARIPYRYAFVRRLPMTTTLTGIGCPHACTFCVTATMPFRLRSCGEVVAELRAIREGGIREVFVFDQTFGIPRARAMDLLARWRRDAPGLSWFTFARADQVDSGLLRAMRLAGCHTVIFGVETGDEALLASTRKALDPARLRRGFRLAREAGLRIAATFLLGLPGETRETIERTARLARKLDPDYASFNVAVPRARTALRREAISRGWMRRGEVIMDQSGSAGGLATGSLSPGEVRAARHRLMRRFYLRPRYLLRAPLRAGSWTGLRGELREGMSILGQGIASRWLLARVHGQPPDRRRGDPACLAGVLEKAPS